MRPNDASERIDFLHAIGFWMLRNWIYEMDIAVPEQRNTSPRKHHSSHACAHPSGQILVSNTTDASNGALSCPCNMKKTVPQPRSEHPHSPSTSGSIVDNALLKLPRTGAMLLAIVALAACATPPAKNFGGPWKPVNHFQSTPTEIPLNPAYVFYASPMDETLKTMLARWAKDSGRELSYQLPFDVTLYQPVANIRTTDIENALGQLNSIYAAQGVSITAGPRKIEVDPVAASSTSPSPPTPAAPASTAQAGTK
jgi:hypothetical protein